MSIDGTAGNDVLSGTGGNDLFKVNQGGDDTVDAGFGRDTIALGATLTAADRINGGIDFDKISIGGDYTGANALVLDNLTLVGIERILLRPGSSYDLTTADGTVAAGDTLLIDGSLLQAGDTLTFDGSNENDGSFLVKASFGDDVITTGGLADAVRLSKTSVDTVSAGGGNDVISVFAGLTAADHIDGGSGTDRVVLNGDYSGVKAITLDSSYLVGIEQFFLRGAHDYTVTTAAGLMPTGDVYVDGRGSSGEITIDGSAETVGQLRFYGGSGDDVLTGGTQRDSFDIKRGGVDTIHGGGGDDVVNAGAALKASDVIDGEAGRNEVVLDGDYGSLNLNATHISRVNEFDLVGGHHYASLSFVGDVTSSHGRLVVDGSASADMMLNFASATSSSYWVIGGDGNDIVNMGAHFSDIFAFDGGDGSDTVNITRNFITAGVPVVTFDDAVFHNVEQITFGTGTRMTNLNITGDIAGGGPMLTISLAPLSATTPVTVDVTGSTTSLFTLTGGKGDDSFTFGSKFDAQDSINGGLGDDTVALDGNYAGAFAGTTLVSVERLLLATGHNYNWETVDAVVAAGASLTIDASAVDAAHNLQFDGDAETDGFFNLIGGAGDDLLIIGGPAVFGGSTIDGGGGVDILALHGDYSANFTLADNLANVEILALDIASSYSLTTIDANVAAGRTLSVQGNTTLSMIFDGSAETDGSFSILGALGASNLKGGSNRDEFDFENSGSAATATIAAGGGDDVFTFSNNFRATDALDGGAGNDTIQLDGTYNGMVMTDTTISSIEQITFLSGHSFNVTTADGNIAAGQSLYVDGSPLTNNTLKFDGSAELDGAFTFVGGASNDVLTGGALADSFDITFGGSDTVHGGGGDDTIKGAAAFSSADKIDGGAGNDVLSMNGSLSVSCNSTTLTSVETLTLLGQNNTYSLTTNDATVAAGATLTIDATALNATHKFTLNGNAETDGSFVVTDGSGNDVLTGGGLSDTFNLFNNGDSAGSDTANGGGGDDIFNMGVSLQAIDKLDGGAGNDVVNLNGSYAGGVTLATTTLTSIEKITANGAFGYDLTTVNANVAAGKALTVDASAVTAAEFFNFNGAQETDGSFIFLDGAGNDNITGGTLADSFDLSHGGTNTARGRGGADAFTSAAGAHADIFVYGAVADSTGAGYDTITNINFATDRINVGTFAGAPTVVESAITTGSLSTASFNTDLAAVVGSGQLGAHHAVLFTADAGTLSGQTFMVIDVNGTTGYQANADLVIHLVNATGTLTGSDFT